MEATVIRGGIRRDLADPFRLKRVAVPDGWLDSRELNPGQATLVQDAELSVSGG